MTAIAEAALYAYTLASTLRLSYGFGLRFVGISRVGFVRFGQRPLKSNKSSVDFTYLIKIVWYIIRPALFFIKISHNPCH
jgi:hypothetical protein